MLDLEWRHFSKCLSKHQEALEYFYFLFPAQKILMHCMVSFRCMFNENKNYSQVRMKEKGKSTKAPFMVTDSSTLSSSERPVEKAASFPLSALFSLPLQRI